MTLVCRNRQRDFFSINNNQRGLKMSTGTVKWFNQKKGYGFIIPETGEKDIFVHISQLEKAGISRLVDGQRIKYELYADRDGRAAAGELRLM